MSVFADSSALVKLYADEDGHEAIRALPVSVVSQLARVEVPAALWRKQRSGALSAQHARLLVADFEADYEGADARFIPLRVTDHVVVLAAQLCAVHGLRPYDAVQLASARAARRAASECDTIAAFDSRLRDAASAEGFALIPG